MNSDPIQALGSDISSCLSFPSSLFGHMNVNPTDDVYGNSVNLALFLNRSYLKIML